MTEPSGTGSLSLGVSPHHARPGEVLGWIPLRQRLTREASAAGMDKPPWQLNEFGPVIADIIGQGHIEQSAQRSLFVIAIPWPPASR